MATRDQVYEAIDGERNYQDYKWPKPAHSHSNTEFLVYIRDYVEEALHNESREDAATVNEKTKHSLRKIAALAVAAMELNGIEYRG